ncbi:WD40-repeat-containing domain protein [Cercophora newfieldiana]|uniref:WD40-repeat-containing domain protein n=1 Tax=Cercophora newfieldiana TaxID=92897 RepID=A0AA39Y6K0_9PEZI|nr:WD40-repeat-containing domain protein [Cercophora newfieldiana]
MAYSAFTHGKVGSAFNKTITGNLENDIVFPAGPEDTISSVRWSPSNKHLAAASWDGKVYVYDVSLPKTANTIKGVTTISSEGDVPFFDCDFDAQGTLLAAVGASHTLSILDTTTDQTSTRPTGHTKPIRTVRFAQPIAIVPCGERIYIMDAGRNGHLVLSTADNVLHVFDLAGGNNPAKAVETRKIPWGGNTKCLAVSNVAAPPHLARRREEGEKTWIVGIEGRAAIQKVVSNPADTKYEYTFKCHRDTLESPTHNDPDARTTNVFTVNALAFHTSERPVMATAGSDGSFVFWDIGNKQRLKAFPKVGGDGVVTSCTFSANGEMFAYAV